MPVVGDEVARAVGTALGTSRNGERTDPSDGSVRAANEFELIEYDCSGAFVQDE